MGPLSIALFSSCHMRDNEHKMRLCMVGRIAIRLKYLSRKISVEKVTHSYASVSIDRTHELIRTANGGSFHSRKPSTSFEDFACSKSF